MKKVLLLTCMALVTAWLSVGGIMAASYIPQQTLTVTADTVIYCTDMTEANTKPASSWIVYPAGWSPKGIKYTNTTGDDAGNPGKLTDNLPTLSENVNGLEIKPDGNVYNKTTRGIHMNVTGVSSIIAHVVNANTQERGFAIGINENKSLTESSKVTEVATMKRVSGSCLLGYDQLDPAKNYIITIYATEGSTHFYAIEFFAPAALAYTVTPASNNEDFGTASITNTVITASPKAGYRVSTTNPYTVDPAGAATVTPNGNAFALSNVTEECTVTINFEVDPNPSVFAGPYPATYELDIDTIAYYNWMSAGSGNTNDRNSSHCPISEPGVYLESKKVDNHTTFKVNGCNMVEFKVFNGKDTEIRKFNVAINSEPVITFNVPHGCNTFSVPVNVTGDATIKVYGSDSKAIYVMVATFRYEKVSLDAGSGSLTGDDELLADADGKVTLPVATPSAACAELGWEFAGWSGKESNVTAADLIPAGSFITDQDTTLYAVYASNFSYELVTQNDGITAGDYLFVGVKDDDYYAIGFQASNNRRGAAVTVEDNKIVTTVAKASTDEESPYEISLIADGNNWILYDKVNGNNLGPATSGSGNNLKANANARFSAAIDATNRIEFICVAGEHNDGRNYLAHNTTSNNNLFACYKESTATGYPDINLYKKTADYSTDPACSFTVTAEANNDSYGTVAYDADTKKLTYTPAYGYRLSETTPYTLTPADVAKVTAVEGENAFVLSKVTEDVTITINFEAYPTTDNLAATAITCEGFTANWDEVEGADKYLVKVFLGNTLIGEANEAMTNSYAVTGLAQVTNYTFSVTVVFGEVQLSPVTSAVVTTTQCFTGDVLTWNGTANDGDWNNPANWEGNVLPTSSVDVKISGNAPKFPVLESEVAVNSIILEPGAQLGNQYLLKCDTAYVSLGFNAGNLATGNWHMLSMPIGEVYSGDFSFGGHPYTFLRKFKIEDSGAESYADWTTEFQSNDEALPIGEGFMFKVNKKGNTFGSKYSGSGTDPLVSNSPRQFGIDQLNGVMMFPYFDNEIQSNARRVHKYDAEKKESTIYSYNYKELVTNPAPVTLARTASSYKLAEKEVSQEVAFAANAAGGNHFALVGNPFVTAIDMDALYAANNEAGKENFKSSYTIWTGKGFSTYMPGGTFGIQEEKTSDLSQYIAPFQSFLIEKGENYAAPFDMVFDNAAIDATNAEGVLLRSASAEAGNKLTITAKTSTSPAFTIYVAKRDNGSDIFCNADGRMVLSAASAIPQIYTLKGSANGGQVGVGGNIINRDDMLIPLSILTTYSGKVSFTFDGMANYMTAKIYFIDVVADKEIDITGLSFYTYSFDYAGSTNVANNRFFIRLAPQGTTGFDAPDADLAYIYAEGGQIKVVAADLNAVYVYNQLGQLVTEAINLNGISSYATGQLAIGEVYLVRTVTEAGVKTHKVIVE
ncbi:hypothetical protein LJB91_01880 [Bacteroidales bacterium OttesenSCG-928-L03]|nr:hypothetical protein [Bacteroidales bacterium OttesenSCG-928-L03]